MSIYFCACVFRAFIQDRIKKKSKEKSKSALPLLRPRVTTAIS